MRSNVYREVATNAPTQKPNYDFPFAGLCNEDQSLDVLVGAERVPQGGRGPPNERRTPPPLYRGPGMQT